MRGPLGHEFLRVRGDVHTLFWFPGFRRIAPQTRTCSDTQVSCVASVPADLSQLTRVRLLLLTKPMCSQLRYVAQWDKFRRIQPNVDISEPTLVNVGQFWAETVRLRARCDRFRTEFGRGRANVVRLQAKFGRSCPDSGPSWRAKCGRLRANFDRVCWPIQAHAWPNLPDVGHAWLDAPHRIARFCGRFLWPSLPKLLDTGPNLADLGRSRPKRLAGQSGRCWSTGSGPTSALIRLQSGCV